MDRAVSSAQMWPAGVALLSVTALVDGEHFRGWLVWVLMFAILGVVGEWKRR